MIQHLRYRLSNTINTISHVLFISSSDELIVGAWRPEESNIYTLYNNVGKLCTLNFELSEITDFTETLVMFVCRKGYPGLARIKVESTSTFTSWETTYYMGKL